MREYPNKIFVHGLKNILHEIEIDDIEKFFDIELAAYLLYPERENYSVAELLAYEFEGLKLADETIFTEAVALEKLGEFYLKKLDAENLTKLYYEIELPLTKVLAKMEMRGVFIDAEKLEEKYLRVGGRRI